MKKENKIILHELNPQGSGFEVGRWEGGLDGNSEALVPHRHDHYTCMILEKGEIEVLLDFKLVVMPESTLFISYPGQIHQVLRNSNASGWYLSFDDKLIESSVRTTLDRSISEIISVRLSGLEYRWFSSIIDSLISLPNINQCSVHEIEHSLLSAFVNQAILTYQQRELSILQAPSSRPVAITLDFKTLVRQNFKKFKRPADYADKMNITVSYLNDTVKTITGSSSSEIIQKEVIAEAQRLLFYTNMSIKEIAVSLGYDDYKYFIRFFSKMAGNPPGAFRLLSSSIV